MNFRLQVESDRERICEYVRSLPLSTPKRVSIDDLKPTRSIEANARLWALYTAISQQAPSHMGGEWHSPEVWHEYLCRRFLGMEAGPFGEGVRKSTRKLTVGQFSDYMQEVEAWAYQQFDGFEFSWELAA